MSEINATLDGLFEVICSRKQNPVEGSYTCYLFEKGLDKILKKCGEECAETIIAAKNGEKHDIVMESADLVYHLLVMLCQCGVSIDELDEELKERLKKQRNLKVMKNTDKNT